jgi:hypothetical protein
MITTEEAEKSSTGYCSESDPAGCTLFGMYPNYVFLVYPDEYADTYRVALALNDVHLETNDFGTAMDEVDRLLAIGRQK